MTVLKSLIYSHLISSVSHTHHNFLHSCLTALPVLTSVSHYILMNLLNSVLHSTSCINKHDLFHFLTHCMKESMQDSYVCKAEVYLVSFSVKSYKFVISILYSRDHTSFCDNKVCLFMNLWFIGPVDD